MKNLYLVLCLFTFVISAKSQDYKLVWEDNFDNTVLNESQLWNVEVNADGGGNQELQYYRRENISIEKAVTGENCLVLSAKKQSYGGRLVTSGRLNTRQNVAVKYGKIEARIKLPHTGNGLWPAFWMLGDDYSSVGWPRCGEIDILEMGNIDGVSQGKQTTFMNGACHWGEYWTFIAQNSTAAYSVQDDFHLFTLIWDESYIKMYLDLDKYPNASAYYTMSIAGSDVDGDVYHYFHKPFSLVFNLAVGGIYTGITGNDNIDQITALSTDGTPAKMYVDYVRIYQKGLAGEEFYGPTSNDVQAPTSFTVTSGNVTSNSVELLLNATDNSGYVFYTINCNGNQLVTKATSGIQTSYIITGLQPNNNYNISIVAKDGSENVASNSPLVINKTTIAGWDGHSTIDFETVGQDWTWGIFGNLDNASSLYSVVSNPNPNGINTSSNCTKYIINPDAASYAGVYSENIGTLPISTANSKVKIMVYKDRISSFDLKFENATSSFDTFVSNSLINQWEELTFDISSHIGKNYTKLVLIPDNSIDRINQHICYWDNISFTSITGVTDVQYHSVKVYPTFVSDILQVKADQKITQIIVRNMLGQIVKSTEINDSEKAISLSDISAGNYLVTVILSNGQISVQKIIKQ